MRQRVRANSFKNAHGGFVECIGGMHNLEGGIAAKHVHDFTGASTGTKECQLHVRIV
jgi:hypothetical protein